ncbi:MAG TPA: hypothetical protein VGM06_22195 [Polyangiaceae bacterium]
MTRVRLLGELEALASRLGVAVRVEAFPGELLHGRGGLCWLRGQPVVLMDSSLSAADRILTLASALSAFDLDAVYVPPFVRAQVESTRR